MKISSYKEMKKTLKTFAALSDPTRLRIVFLLLERDLCVCELEFILKMSQSRMSHQLRILRDAGLVKDKREGQWIIYSIPVRTRKRLRTALEALSGDDWTAAQEIAADRENLRACLRQKIRPGPKGES